MSHQNKEQGKSAPRVDAPSFAGVVPVPEKTLRSRAAHPHPPAPSRGVMLALDSQGNPMSDHENAAAKCEEVEGKTRYFVKAGVDSGFYNPLGLYAKTDDLVAMDRRQGRRRFEYVEVTKEGFDNYVLFLTQKHAKFLREAERGRKNA